MYILPGRILIRLVLIVVPAVIAGGLAASAPAYADGTSCQWAGQTFSGTQTAGGIPFTCTQGTNGPYWQAGNYNGNPDTLPTPGVSSSVQGQDAPGWSPGAAEPDENGDMWMTALDEDGNVYWDPAGTVEMWNWDGAGDDGIGPCDTDVCYLQP